MSVAIIVVNRTKVSPEDFQSNSIYEKDHRRISGVLYKVIPQAFSNAIFVKDYFHINSGMKWEEVVDVFRNQIKARDYKGVLVYLCDDLNAMTHYPLELMGAGIVYFHQAPWFAHMHFKNNLTALDLPESILPKLEVEVLPTPNLT